MSTTPLKILAINPGSRYLGMAVFHGPELRDWGVKAFKGRWKEGKTEKVKKTISILIDYWRPNILAMKRLHPSRRSKELSRLSEKIKELAKKKKLKVCQYSIQEIKDFLSPGQRINKKKLAELLALQYPELTTDLTREKSRKNPYYVRCFEAVALGSMCLHQLDK